MITEKIIDSWWNIANKFQEVPDRSKDITMFAHIIEEGVSKSRDRSGDYAAVVFIEQIEKLYSLYKVVRMYDGVFDCVEMEYFLAAIRQETKRLGLNSYYGS